MKQYAIIKYLTALLISVITLQGVAQDDNIKSLSDYGFIGTGYGYLTASSTPAPGVQVPFVPDLTGLNDLEIVYIAPDGDGDGSSESQPTSLEDALEGSVQNRVIVALDGTYHQTEIKLNHFDNVYLIAKNKGGATLVSDDNNFELPNSNAEIHNFSIIGFRAVGNGNKYNNYFIFGPGNGLNYNAYNIYLCDMEWSNYSCVIYSGLHSHDWTIDRSLFYDPVYEYIWYMMGWHHTLMNCVMYNDSYMAACIRGSFPPDEEYVYGSFDNTLITSRDHHFLASNDWTHLVINNTFGSCHKFIPDHAQDVHLAMWYDPPSDKHNKTEDCYFPPQNIVIANNAFIDNGMKHKKAILFAASRGLNDPDTTNIASVNGVVIINNYCDNRVFLKPFGETDMSSVDLVSNVSSFSDFGFDDENRNYTLQPSSGLIDKGSTAVYFPSVDFAGNLRNDIPDAGAFENTLTSIKVLGTNLSDNVIIYPNPSEGFLNVKLLKPAEKFNILIRNSSGQLVQSFSYNSTDTVSMDLRDLPSGVYIMSINDMLHNKQIGIQKISIVR
jgi:hypothetical protein